MSTSETDDPSGATHPCSPLARRRPPRRAASRPGGRTWCTGTSSGRRGQASPHRGLCVRQRFVKRLLLDPDAACMCQMTNELDSSSCALGFERCSENSSCLWAASVISYYCPSGKMTFIFSTKSMWMLLVWLGWAKEWALCGKSATPNFVVTVRPLVIALVVGRKSSKKGTESYLLLT